MIRFSRWCHTFAKDGIVAFLHSISLEVVYFSEKMGDLVIKLFSNPISIENAVELLRLNNVRLLTERRIIVENKDEDQKYFEDVRRKLIDEVAFQWMYLLVTDNCNLKCLYCFEETPVCVERFVPKNMNEETAKNAIDLFARLVAKYGNPKKKKIINLYGGEPLLNPDVIRFVVLYARQLKKQGILPKNCETVIVTNCVLFTEEFARFFAENGVVVGISIDGPIDINNRYRVPKAKDINVFNGVKRAYALLKKYQAKVGLSITLVPEAIENFDRMMEFVLNEMKDDDGGDIDGLSFNLLHYNQNICPGQCYYENGARFLIKAFEILRKKGIYEERMVRKINAFLEQKPMYSDCGVVGFQIVIAPDGMIGVCQDFVKPRTYFRNSVNDLGIDPITSGLFDEWKLRSPFFMDQCFNCEAIGICGGGCPASAELKTGSRWNIDDRICAHSKLSLEWLVWDAYEKMSEQR